jgi:tetratricopeptide (TPR) repeat protein
VALPVVGALVAAYVHSRPELERARLERIDAEREVILAEAAYELSEGGAEAALVAYERAAAMEGVSPDAIVGRALAHLRLDDPAAALVALEAPAAEQAGPHGVRLLRVDALRALRRDAEAESLAATAPPPATAFDFALLALREVQTGDATGKLEPFRAGLRHAATAIFLSPRPRLSHFSLYAHAAGHTADPSACRRAADALRRHWPAEPSALFWAGYALDSAGPQTRAEAAALYRESIRLTPNDAGPHLNLGLILYQSGKIDEAEREYREAIRCAPRLAEAHHVLGNLLDKADRDEEAVSSYRTALALRPADPRTRGNLAAVLESVGRRDEAIEILKRLVDELPAGGVERRNLGVMLTRAGDAAGAEKELLSVATADPADAEARLALVDLYRRQDRFAEAETHAREGVRYAPGRGDLQQALAFVLTRQHRYSEAVAPYLESLRLTPDDPHLPVDVAQVLRAAKRPDDALDVLREAARKRPQDWKTLVEYGVAAAGRGRPEEALRVLRAAEAVRPDEPNTRINLGLVWTELGRCEEAVAAFRAGHERGLRNPKWDRPSAAWLENAEKTLEDDRRRDDAVRARRAANDPPKDGGAAGDAARRWIRLGEPELGVAWCVAAFAADEDEGLAWKDRRYFRAACAAAAALPRAKEEDAALLRSHARAWLVLETSRYAEALAEKTVPPDEIVRGLAAYDDASLLTPFRGEGIAALPADERASWEAWAKEVARLRDAARAAFLAGG